MVASIPAVSSAADQPAPRCNDATFLRRVSLDLIGRQPTPSEQKAFQALPEATRRTDLVDRLLGEEAWATNWARYFRDVILYRRSDERARLLAEPLERFFAEALADDARWDAIARRMITATGSPSDHGETAIILAQMGETSDIAAEVSRVFMGIQIQCAQCHDHFTDRWKREQFHEFAAFFPRITIRRGDGKGLDRFEVVSHDHEPRFRRKRPNNPRRGDLEHRMPDLEDPSRPGRLMQPVFFLSGERLPAGTPDRVRRETVAEWIIDGDHPWFARAIVNRLHSELVGQGFYGSIDDLGPDRDPVAEAELDRLASGFVASGHDLRWLFRTIIAGDTYQRESRSRPVEPSAGFPASCPQPLRADQLYSQLLTALGIDESAVGRRTAARFASRTGTAAGKAPGGDKEMRMQIASRLGKRLPRTMFETVFGYDPGLPRGEVSGSIPQVLWLMNSPLLAMATDADRSHTGLAQLLASESNDAEVVRELYRRSLAREPEQRELTACLRHLRISDSRGEGFEDIQWALLNSTEFVLRR